MTFDCVYSAHVIRAKHLAAQLTAKQGDPWMAAQLTAKQGADVLSIAETKAYDSLEGEFAEVRPCICFPCCRAAEQLRASIAVPPHAQAWLGGENG